MRLLEPAPVRAGDAVTYRGTPAPQRRVIAGFWGGLCVLTFGLAVSGIVIGQPILFWSMLFVTALTVGAAVFFIRQAFLPPVLTTTQLLLPGLFSGWEAFELADVAGVGLRFSHGAGHPGQWVLNVWMDDGTRRQLLTMGKPIGELTGADRHGFPPGEKEREASWQLLAGTEYGQIATRIAEQTRVVQGADGLLAHRRAERTAAPSASEMAYWSPDGDMGALQ